MQSISLLVQVFTLLFIGNASTYNEDEAYNTLAYAYGAYCDAEDLKKWDCTWCSSNFDITSNGAGVIDTDDLQAFMGYDHDKTRIVLSFRGSANIENWINNFELTLTAYPHYNNGAGSIHSGFHSNWLKLEEYGLSTMIKSMFAGYPGADILLTGHSLGGALAQLAALDLLHDSEYTTLSIGSVNVIDFGSPRWADETIANRYNDMIDSNWRIVNEYDAAPQVPLQQMGYHHTGTMIRYLSAETRDYAECDSSGEEHWTTSFVNPDCWLWLADVLDHMWYFNVYATCSFDSTALSANEVILDDPYWSPDFITTEGIESVDIIIGDLDDEEDSEEELSTTDMVSTDDGDMIQITNMVNVLGEEANGEGDDGNIGCDMTFLEMMRWDFILLCVTGYLLAFLFCVCWCRAKRELMRMNECGRKMEHDLTSVSI